MKNSPNTKVWIYQNSNPICEEHINEIKKILTKFTSNWQAHGQTLTAGFEIKYNLFIILWVDEDFVQKSGCSIDSSVKIMKEIELLFGLNLFNRFNMAWLQYGVLYTADKDNFAQLVIDKTINADTIVFNNMVQNAFEYTHNWQIPFSQSWHNQVFSFV